MTKFEHEHTWRGQMHFDGCHFYRNSYVCNCGAFMQIGGERQMRGRHPEGLYMALEGCERCDALIGGARRTPTLKYVKELGGKWKRVKLNA